MKITCHRTDSMFRRYAIVNEEQKTRSARQNTAVPRCFCESQGCRDRINNLGGPSTMSNLITQIGFEPAIDPGSILKMSRLATDSRYHFGDRIKLKLVLVDYLMQSNQSTINAVPSFLQ
jgi:hypothetical protein